MATWYLYYTTRRLSSPPTTDQEMSKEQLPLSVSLGVQTFGKTAREVELSPPPTGAGQPSGGMIQTPRGHYMKLTSLLMTLVIADQAILTALVAFPWTPLKTPLRCLRLTLKGTKYKWSFNSANPVAHAAWRAFHDDQVIGNGDVLNAAPTGIQWY
ncbi:hypothetical protein OS493_039315 [Desmophyllum pertusum]|uniref:Uncharacterized protein n=1 Tax=Desmophyllum pertusum TaxID=174260 RepID=A0A9X0CZJ9_9CNID|nr:hypothetical protein OS493_039315 [Desmophyllum pertusum]